MNFHKTILNLGFKRVGYHEREWNRDDNYRYKMVEKKVIEQTIFDYSTKKYTVKVTKPPKWTFFYNLKIGRFTIWIRIDKNSLVSIYLDDDNNRDGVLSICDNVTITSIKDLINLMPIEIQRELNLVLLLK